MDNSTVINLGTYLDKKKTFIIPNYQREYIWGKNMNEQEDSATYLIKSIITNFHDESDLFLQGITVTECKDSITIIDGQQRTTAFYLLLCYLGYLGYKNHDFSISYPIRKKSDEFLKDIKKVKSQKEILKFCDEDIDEPYQDIYYFKKTIRIYSKELAAYFKDTNKILDFVLNKVKFIYITIPTEHAFTSFTMMNGNKATMQTEEIIKAEILRNISKNKTIEKKEEYTAMWFTYRWEVNTLRSKYAREWDKWLYWWNRNDVKDFWGCNNVMGLLISTYYETEYQLRKGNKTKDFNFETFCSLCLRNNEAGTENAVIKTFLNLRGLQKRFEDAFNEPKTYNMIGTILSIFNKKNKSDFIKYYFSSSNSLDISKYYNLLFLGMTHSDIIKTLNGEVTESAFDKAYDEVLSALSDDNVYDNDKDIKEIAFRWLLRLNIDQDNILGKDGEARKFDFNIWRKRSLEHIFPKSKEPDFNKHNKTNSTVHCIGNIVLLYKINNSSFSDKDFDKKKELLFDFSIKEYFESRQLLHTMSIFAKSKEWGPKEVKSNKLAIIEHYKNCYKEYKYDK